MIMINDNVNTNLTGERRSEWFEMSWLERGNEIKFPIFKLNVCTIKLLHKY